MGKKYDGNGTVSFALEASGSGSFFAVDSKSASGKDIATKKGTPEITKAWLIGVEDTTMESQSEMEVGDVTNLLQTNVLLIAVLIVCFITLASVIAICGCMIRRYCKNREQRSSNGVHQQTGVSKSTSVTGLNSTHECYPMKVKKSNQSHTIRQISSENVVPCAPNSKVAVLDLTRSPSDTEEFNSAMPFPSCRPDIVLPIHVQMDNVLTSTPAIPKQHCDTGNNVQCVEEGFNSLFPDLCNPTTEAMSSEEACDTLRPKLPDQTGNIEQERSHGEERTPQVVMRAPSSHSVSWFVSLTGDRTGSIRHSITENTYQGLNMKNYDNCPSDQRNGKRSNKAKGQKNPEHHPLCEWDESDSGTSQPMSAASKFVCSDSNCQATDEKVPLIEKIHHSTSAMHSVASKRPGLPVVAEGQESHHTTTHSTLPQSSSLPDDSNTWKQREERPVLFLGSGAK